MTKEELKKEAKSYAKRKFDEEEQAYLHDIIAHTYFVGAEPREKRIEELEKENKTLEGCLLAEQEHTQMLEQQIEKMKRHCNCKHRDGEGYCEVKRTYLMDLSYDGCDKWELED